VNLNRLLVLVARLREGAQCGGKLLAQLGVFDLHAAQFRQLDRLDPAVVDEVRHPHVDHLRVRRVPALALLLLDAHHGALHVR